VATFFDESEIPPDADPEWEPLNVDAWRDADVLGSRLLERSHHRESQSERIVSMEFNAWRRLPRPLRRQSWREREVGAALLDQEDRLVQIPGAQRIGVGVRALNGRRRVVAIVNVAHDESFGVAFDSFPVSLEVSTRLSNYGVPTSVPIVFEAANSRTPMHGEHVCAGDAQEAPCGRPLVSSGSPVRVRGARGLCGHRTVCAVVIDAFAEPWLLSAAHGIESVNDDVFLGSGQMIGTVRRVEPVLDAVLIQPHDTYLCLSLPEPPVPLHPPVIVPGGFPVQMFGGKSGHQVGFISESYSWEFSGWRMGHHT